MDEAVNSAESSDRKTIEELMEEFVDRLHRGERPSISEYIRKSATLADEIRDVFPALAMLEQFGSPPDNPGKTCASTPTLEQLGGYRILREVGRGGMGVVYEAIQEPLGRHVALKVLPLHLAGDPVCLERFQREARVAARLHHTNIVPVFDVGQHDGIHFYTMQFIEGQGLDQVIAELIRRDRNRQWGSRWSAAANLLAARRSHAESHGVLSRADSSPLLLRYPQIRRSRMPLERSDSSIAR